MESTNSKKLVVLALILAIGGVIAFIAHGRRAPKQVDLLGDNVPAVLAEEAAKLLNPQGQVVVVALEASAVPGVPSRLDIFRQHLKQLKAATIVGVETIPPQVLTGIPAAVYFETLKKFPEADVLVSFIGPPELTDADQARLGQKLPKVVAFSQSPINAGALFQRGALSVLIMPRASRSKVAVAQFKTAREKFDHNYEIVTH